MYKVFSSTQYPFLFLGELALTIAKGPLEMLLGIVYGLVFGVFLWYFPSKDNVSS